MRTRACTSLAALLLLTLLPCLSTAATWCVRNGTELQQALTDAAASNSDDEIRVREGIYTVFNQPFTYNSQNAGWLFVTGGWYTIDNNDCAQQRLEASRTILEGAGQHQVLRLYRQNGSTLTSRIGVQNLTLTNGWGDPALNQQGGALVMASYADAYTELWLDNLVVSNSSAQFGGGAELYVTNGMVRVANSLFANNNAAIAEAHIAISAPSTEPGATSAVILANSTFVGGRCPGGSGRGCSVRAGLGGGVRMDIVNSLFHDNQISDVDLEGLAFVGLGDGTAYADSSLVATTGGSLVLDATRALAGDPHFVDAPNRNYRLRDDSPFINQGLGMVPLYPFFSADLDGQLRTRYGSLDPGAYENRTWDFLFANGFN